jgi:hypothetical protein
MAVDRLARRKTVVVDAEAQLRHSAVAMRVAAWQCVAWVVRVAADGGVQIFSEGSDVPLLNFATDTSSDVPSAYNMFELGLLWVSTADTADIFIDDVVLALQPLTCE